MFLVGILGAMLLPSVPERAQAVEGDGGATTYATGASVSLGVPATIDFEAVTPTANGATTTATANVTVATTNSAGYSLYLYAEGGNNLVAQNPATAEVVTATASSATLDGLANNTWGYNLGTAATGTGTTYAAVPTDGTTPVQTKDTSSTNAANDTYTLALGAKVDTTIPSGTYTGALTVAVVAEAPKVVFNGITTMQEMTPDICSNALENDTTRLIDSRDGKYYWVAKLADGNCWMTQNLDFDLSTSQALTSSTSDVSASWTPTISTSSTPYNSTSNTGLYSYDAGLFVRLNVGNYGTCNDVQSLASCAAGEWQNVSTLEPMEQVRSDGVVVEDGKYDAHYLIGNYYQWNTATAGKGSTNTNLDASWSICPKGWHLPTGNNSNAGSFGALIDASGVDKLSIMKAPLYFVPGGLVYSGALWFVGSGGRYWSSTAYSSTDSAYYLLFTTADLNPTNYDSRHGGFSVRCVANDGSEGGDIPSNP